jgi:predicted unusual protein kinase regulating ubiquinone biosynthesis (AarF/ABC1/UbiB family)
LATLDILIPEAYSNELIKLCEHTYYSEFPEIEILFKKEMKCSIEDIFSSFEKIPIKSASIA